MILASLLIFSSLSASPIPITLEHAVTENELSFGLMNRDTLAENSGMTFNYPSTTYLNCWMFNCRIDLSLAFLNSDHVIQEIYELKAYPEKMDPKRVVKTISDFSLYPPYDPIWRFFLSQTIRSSKPAQFALEMNKGWFDKHGIKPNDVVLWDLSKPQGLVLKSVNVDPLLKDNKARLNLDPPSEVSLIASSPLTVTFFDNNGRSITKHLHPLKPLYTKFKVSYALISKN